MYQYCRRIKDVHKIVTMRPIFVNKKFVPPLLSKNCPKLPYTHIALWSRIYQLDLSCYLFTQMTLILKINTLVWFLMPIIAARKVINAAILIEIKTEWKDEKEKVNKSLFHFFKWNFARIAKLPFRAKKGFIERKDLLQKRFLWLSICPNCLYCTGCLHCLYCLYS